MFVALDAESVRQRCTKEKVGVSALEAIPAGGVRLVCMSSDGARIMRAKFKSQMITGEVVRARHRPIRPLW